MIKLIVAIGPKGLIGVGNKLPWKIKEELKFFKEATLKQTLLMGRKTFNGLPGHLPQRKFIVLGSGELKHKADQIIKSEKEIQEIFNTFKTSLDILYIAGGKSIYEQFYHYADELIISEVNTDQKGDVFLNLDLQDYELTSSQTFKEFIVKKYSRRK